MALSIEQQYNSIKYGIIRVLERQNPNFETLSKSEQENLAVEMIEKLHNDVLNLISQIK